MFKFVDVNKTWFIEVFIERVPDITHRHLWYYVLRSYKLKKKKEAYKEESKKKNKNKKQKTKNKKKKNKQNTKTLQGRLLLLMFSYGDDFLHIL
jgi:ribonucleotide reductase alpha subunit